MKNFFSYDKLNVRRGFEPSISFMSWIYKNLFVEPLTPSPHIQPPLISTCRSDLILFGYIYSTNTKFSSFRDTTVQNLDFTRQTTDITHFAIVFQYDVISY